MHRIGFALCGSFCTLKEAVEQIRVLRDLGNDVFPIMSETVFNTDSRFGKAEEFKGLCREYSGHDIISTVTGAEPIGPRKLLDLLIIAPCTGNTLAKLALGVTDTAVTMAAKAHLRNGRPLLIAPATNDGLGAGAKNIGLLLNAKNVFFVPFGQDDAKGKPTSLIADFALIPTASEAALENRQIQPLLITK